MGGSVGDVSFGNTGKGSLSSIRPDRIREHLQRHLQIALRGWYCGATFSLALFSQACVARPYNCLSAVSNLELGKDVRDVVAHRFGAEV